MMTDQQQKTYVTELNEMLRTAIKTVDRSMKAAQRAGHVEGLEAAAEAVETVIERLNELVDPSRETLEMLHGLRDGISASASLVSLDGQFDE